MAEQVIGIIVGVVMFFIVAFTVSQHMTNATEAKKEADARAAQYKAQQQLMDSVKYRTPN